MQFCWVSFLIGFGSEKRPKKDTQKKQGRFKPWVVFINGDFTCGLALRCIVHGPQAKRDDEETSPKSSSKKRNQGKNILPAVGMKGWQLKQSPWTCPSPRNFKNVQKCSKMFVWHWKVWKQIHFEHCPRQTQNSQNCSIFLNFAQKVTLSHFISLYLTCGKLILKLFLIWSSNSKISKFFNFFNFSHQFKMKGYDGEKKFKIVQNVRKMQKSADFSSPALVVTRVSTVGQTCETPRWFYPTSVPGISNFLKKIQFFHGLLKKHCPLHPKKYQNFPTFLRKPGSSWLLTLYSIFPIYLKRSPKNYQKVRVYALAMELKVSRNASRTKRIQHRHQAWNNLGMRSCARSWHKIRKRLRVRAHSKRVFLLYTAVP